MKKGFTLIELLAVIVILAIIALIATPIILSIISDARESADLRGAELYVSAVELSVANKNLTEEFRDAKCKIQSDGNLLCYTVCEIVDDECVYSKLGVEMNGSNAISGVIIIKDSKINSIRNMKIGDNYFSLESSGNIEASKEKNARLCGDANNDDLVNEEDAKLISKYAASGSGLESEDINYADVNGDGTPNAKDANLINRYALGKSGIEVLRCNLD